MHPTASSMADSMPIYSDCVWPAGIHVPTTTNRPWSKADSGLNEPRLSVAVIMLPERTPIPGTGNLALKRSVAAELQVVRDGFILRTQDLDEESYGQRVEDALRDFLTSLRDRYESLRRRESRLSPRDRDVLARLQMILGPRLE